MLLTILLAVITTLLVSAQSEVPSKLLTLQKDTSFVTLSPISWNLKEDGEQLIVPIRFRTRAHQGRLITLLGSDESGPLFTLSAFVQSSAIIIDVIDGAGKTVKRTERQIPDANNGKEHSMSLQFNPVKQQLKVVYGQGTVDTYDRINNIHAGDHIDLTLTAGKYGEHKGIAGCVTLVALSVGSRFATEFPETERSEGVVDGCASLCDGHNCNEGTCVDFFEAALCDCRTTHRSGDHCDEDTKALNVSWDQYIAYEVADEESQPHVISIDFKTTAKEGVLVHGNVLSATDGSAMGDLQLKLIYGQIRLTIGELIELNIDSAVIAPDEFHEVILSFNYPMSEVTLSFNGIMETGSWYHAGKEIDIRFGNEIFFSAGGSDVGLSGCLRRIYVGYHDVISGYLSSSDKVKASTALKSCDTNPAAAPVNLLSPVHDDGLVPLEKDHPTEGLWSYEEKAKALPHDDDGHHEDHEDIDTLHDKIQDEIYSAVDSNKPMEGLTIPEGEVEKFIAEIPTRKLLCENNEATFCKNHVECVKKGSTPVCVCKKGFVGQNCQFSTLPWNCADVLSSGNTEAGTYIIDVDGSGPLLETYVYCNNGHTIVPHNMPNRTLMRAAKLGDIRLLINYRLMNEDELRHLRELSQECSQKLIYACDKAPLGLGTGKTRFTSLYDHTYGTVDNQNAVGCDTHAIDQDKLDLSGVNVPITNIVALNEPTDRQGHVTLTSLDCHGSAGSTQSHMATFRNRADSLKLGDWNGRRLSVEIRVYENHLTIISSRDGAIELELHDRTLHLVIGGNNISLTPQSRLNDGQWHRIVVEIIDNTLRISADDSIDFAPLTKAITFKTVPIFVGGGKDGYLGCVRQVILADKALNMQSLLMHDSSISLGCEDMCQMHDCQHQSKCVQDFEHNIARCECLNNIIHSGPLCENSVNKDSEVSLHNLKRGFLKIQKPSTSDAIKQRIVLSVRTDRRDALIAYMHDHLYNFVQIHLSDHTRIVLTTNYNGTVRRCEVVAKIGQEFSRMKWIQIMLFQDNDHVRLNVDDEVCEIAGVRMLSEDLITRYEIDQDMEDVVEPPVTPLKRESDNRPFTLLFIGGVPTENYKGKLDPTYKTTVPTLLGCIRGLMVGNEVINLRDTTFWPYYPQEQYFVNIGCKTGCEAVSPTCKNDGHCTFKWMTADPSATLATCNCKRTSYYGEHCDKDSGAQFHGNSMIRFNSGEVLAQAIYDWTKLGEQTFDFAFAAKVDSPLPQYLATISFEKNRWMELTLRKNGSLNVAVSAPDSTVFVHTFPFNFTDGYRHFFQSIFNGKTPLSVAVDSSKFQIPSEVARDLSLAKAVTYDFGGVSETRSSHGFLTADASQHIHNYSGCIANIDINLNVGRMHFKPNSYLEDKSDEFAKHTKMIGDELIIGSCSSFKIPGTLPALQHNVNAPEWESPFQTEKFARPVIGEPTTTEEPGSDFPWWIIILIICIILLIILLIILFFCCRKKKKQPQDPERPPANVNGNKDDVALPLIPIVPVERPPTLLNNYDLPEPTQSLDRSYMNSPPQPKAGGGNEALDDLDSTLNDYDEDATLLPGHDDVQGFNRSTPQRLSSFKKGDPTAPVDSPLYRPTDSRRPKPVPPPKSPNL